MGSLLTLLSAAAPLALIMMLWVMAQISRRFGEVTHRPPFYRGFYGAMVLLLVPLGVRLLAIGGSGDSTIEELLYNLPLVISMTLAVIIAWRYWGWLVYAREGQAPISSPSTKQKRA
jgi:uncharacterized membrane protein YphA (DoxX/SURF4 family)